MELKLKTSILGNVDRKHAHNILLKAFPEEKQLPRLGKKLLMVKPWSKYIIGEKSIGIAHISPNVFEISVDELNTEANNE